MNYLFLWIFCLGIVNGCFGAPPPKQKKEPAQETPIPSSYQIVIIGGGPAGLSCGIRCAEYGFSTAIIDIQRSAPPQPLFPIQNWPGLQNSVWSELMQQQQKIFRTTGGILIPKKALSITRSRGAFSIRTESGSYESKVCVIATGKKFISPSCQLSIMEPSRIFFRLYSTDIFKPSDTVCVVGEDLHTIQTTIMLLPKVAKVYLFTKPTLTIPNELLAILQQHKNLSIITQDRIIKASNQKNTCLLEYAAKHSKYTQEASYILFASLWPPESTIIKHLVETDSNEAIITFDTSGSTRSPGLFACGEVSSQEFLPGITAAASGTNTGINVCRYLLEKGEKVTPPVKKEKTTPAMVQEATEKKEQTPPQ